MGSKIEEIGDNLNPEMVDTNEKINEKDRNDSSQVSLKHSANMGEKRERNNVRGSRRNVI